jgi:DNA-3-methyladenine glycosylase I
MRCFGTGDELYESYHDREWGRPVTDDRGLFERFCLEAMQSGLSWLIVLRKRPTLRRAWHNFDAERVAAMGEREVRTLLSDPGVIRNRAKIEATIANARALMALVERGGSLAEIVWSHRPASGLARGRLGDLPATTLESTALAKRLKQLGWRFVGPTTAYATMQACGVVNDHLSECELREEVEREQRAAASRMVSGVARD